MPAKNSKVDRDAIKRETAKNGKMPQPPMPKSPFGERRLLLDDRPQIDIPARKKPRMGYSIF